MKITKRDLSVIMILVGVLSVFLVYQFYFTSKQTEVESLQAEQKSIQTKINDLQPIKDNAPYYTQEMERFKKELSGMMDEFPANVLYENGIMYVVELEDNLAVEIPNFTVNEAEETGRVEGAGSLADYTYALATSSVNFNYTVDTYDDMKELVNYIYADKENKRTVSSISMVFNNKTGEITGAATLNMFAMTDGTSIYIPEKLPLDNLGLENIFGEIVEEEEEE